MDQDKTMKISQKKSQKSKQNINTIFKKEIKSIEQDPYFYIWLIFVVSLTLMTVFFKPYIKGMINISILFLAFWYIEPFMFGVTGTTVSNIISRGKKVDEWKRFPLFFSIIVLVYVLYGGVQFLLDTAFPDEHVNFVFVIIWLAFLFVLWVDRFSKELGK